MSTALATQNENHPAVLAGLAPAGRSEKELELAARFAELSNEEIVRREKGWDILGSCAILGIFASPPIGLLLSLWSSDLALIIGVSATAAATSLGGVIFSARHCINYGNAKKLREIRAKKDGEAQLIADLDERFAVKLSPNELSRLQYPEKTPQWDGTIRYGTIDRMIQDPEGEGARLEQITLVWSNGEFHLLRQSNAFESVREGGLR